MSRRGTSLRMCAPAKLNLYLHIVGKRADGFHLIDSLIAFTEIGDVVSVSWADRLTLTGIGPFAADLPPADDNLAMRAATMLCSRAAVAGGAAIRLEKNLPIASGIGGGSADAAAVLRVLATLWQLDARAVGMRDIARALGADVPVCVDCSTSRVGGIGDVIVAKHDLPPAALVLANPGVALATAEVFRRYTASPEAGGRQPPADCDWTGITDASALAERLAGCDNDLEAPAVALVPDIADTLGALRAATGCLLARMSGSGATCFGLFRDETKAETAARALRCDYPGWWVAATRLRAVAPAPATT